MKLNRATFGVQRIAVVWYLLLSAVDNPYDSCLLSINGFSCHLNSPMTVLQAWESPHNRLLPLPIIIADDYLRVGT